MTKVKTVDEILASYYEGAEDTIAGQHYLADLAKNNQKTFTVLLTEEEIQRLEKLIQTQVDIHKIYTLPSYEETNTMHVAILNKLAKA